MKIHIVKKGDTLWKIAQKYNLDFEKLKEFNKKIENPDKIFPGMKIKIPSNSVPLNPQTSLESQFQNVSDSSKMQPIFDFPTEELAPSPIPEPIPTPAPAPTPFMQAPMEQQPSAPTPQASPFMPIMPPMMPQFAPFPFCPPMNPYHDPCNPMKQGEMNFNPFQQNPHMMYSQFPFPYMTPMPFQPGSPGMSGMPGGMPGMPPSPTPNMGVDPQIPNAGMPEGEVPYQQPYCPPTTKKKKKGRNRN